MSGYWTVCYKYNNSTNCSAGSAAAPGSDAEANAAKLQALAFKAARPDLSAIEAFVKNLHK